ncbi:unnamed protein product [Menidia menidia]|uniref:(Atlantic silverside) hypothetical protein n=1 Tax=Menidia menidia TaxID=238744 RepID=A0A8S4BVK1_9TELE|nr:unnamed protein product [Menidia menidia]
MGRNIETPLPVCPSSPPTRAWPDLRAFEVKDKELERKQAEGYNTRHRGKGKTPLQPGQRVWIKNETRTGEVSGSAGTPRSYIMDTSNGSLRRNHSHLRVGPSPLTTPDPGIRTRVGRAVKPIKRLNLMLFLDMEFQTLKLKATDNSARQHILTIKLSPKNFKSALKYKNQMDHDMVRVAQCSAGDGVISVADSGVTVIQNIFLSGRTFYKLSVFWEFVGEVTFVKVAEDNN